MKKISKSTIEQLKAIEPDTLVAHGIISEAPNHKGNYGYVCLLCGSGTGQNHNGRGDGGGSFDDDNQFFCHACSNEDVGRHKISTIDLFAISRNLPTSNFYENCQLMADEFNIPIEYDDDNTTRKTSKTSKKKVIEIKPPIVDTKELAIIRADLATSDEPLRDLFKYSGDNYLWRGLPLELLLKFGCRFIANWKRPNQRDLDYVTKTPRMIIPCSDSSYLARLTIPIERYDDKQRQYIIEKEHVGTKKLFNATALNSGEAIFCTEGYIDAMSIEFAGFKAVALGAASRGDLLVDVVKTMERKPLIIILLDSDAQGRKDAPKLNKELIKVGCPCVVRFLADSDSKIDCNEILQTQGLDVLRGILQKLVDDSITELAAVEEEILQTVPAIFSQDERDFYFGGSVTDKDNARRLEKFCGSIVRWLTDSEIWLTWQDTVWQYGSKENHNVLPFAFALSDRLLASAPLVEDATTAKKAWRIGYMFADQKSYNPAISAFKGIKSIRITSKDLNKHAHLLNTPNGVIDLQTKKIYDAEPSLLLTQQISVAYDEHADLTLIDKFFRDIMPDETTRRALLRWLGYNLSGSVIEELFLIWLGSGANGKGVLSRLMAALLRDYAAALPQGALLLNRNIDGNAHTAALCSLIHTRFAICEELPQNFTLNAALLKTLTGSDLQKFRPMYGNFIEVTPTAKINMSSNFVPKFENVDDDGWNRRFLVMPFTQTFTGNKADRHLKERLLQPENLRALLRLLVDEAFNWYRDGLIISDEMKEATKENRDANDFVSDFLSEFCDVGEGKGEMPRAALLDKLRNKCIQSNRFSDRELCKMIEKRGVEYKKTMHGRVFKGIRFLTDDDFVGEPIDKDDIPFDN